MYIFHENPEIISEKHFNKISSQINASIEEFKKSRKQPNVVLPNKVIKRKFAKDGEIFDLENMQGILEMPD